MANDSRQGCTSASARDNDAVLAGGHPPVAELSFVDEAASHWRACLAP
jgi:hypothetical protein